MTEVELERIFVRLVGDGSSFQAMLNMANTASQATASIVEAAGRRIEGFAASLKTYGDAAIGALTAIGATSFLNTAYNSFTSFEQIVLKLSAAIQANGREVEGAMASYKAFADEMRDTLGISKSATLQQLAFAEAMGMYGKTATDAVRVANSMAIAFGGEASQYMRVTEALATGNTQLLYRIRQLRGLHSEEEKLQKLQKMVDQSMGIAKSMMDSSAATMGRFTMALGALRAQFGEFVGTAVKPAIAWLTDIVKQFTSLDEATKHTVVMFAFLSAGVLSIAPAFFALQKLLTPFLALFTALLSPIGLVAAALVAGAFALDEWIASVGGIKDAWKIARKAAEDAWAWTKPVRDELKALWGDIADGAASTFHTIKAFAASLWKDLPTVDWGEVRDVAVAAVRAIRAAVVGVRDAITWAWTDGWKHAVEAVEPVLDAVKELASTTAEWVASFVSENARIISFLAVVAVGVYGVVKAYAALQAVFVVLKVQQLASIAFWVAASTAIGAAKAVLVLFNASYAVLNFLLTTGFGITVAAQAAIWLLNAALTMLNALLSVTSLLAFVATMGLVGAVVVGVGAAAYAAWAAFNALLDVVGSMPELAGPFMEVGEMMGEWGPLLSATWQALQVDSDLAWAFVAAAGTLAMAQIRDLFPPLWKYISEGFMALGDFIADAFPIKFREAVKVVKNEAARALDFFNDDEDYDDFLKKIRAETEAEMEQVQKSLKRALGKTVDAFAVVESIETKAAKEGIEELMEELEQLQIAQAHGLFKDIAPMVAEADKAGDKVGSTFAGSAKKHMMKLDAALFGSAEAAARIAAYSDMLAGERKSSPRVEAAEAGGAEAAARQREQLEVLKSVDKVLHDINGRTPVEIALALGGL